MKRLLLLLAALIGLNLLLPGLASADVNDFTVTDFAADYYLSRNDPQGELRIVEHISVDFTDYNHGLLRAIPAKYKGLPAHLKVHSITSTSGAPTKYTTYSSNGNTVLKIGDPNRTVTGQQEYTIDYQVQNVISFYRDHDELYWNINGNQWEQPFLAVRATVHLPDGLKQWAEPPKCYAGVDGSRAQSCEVIGVGNIITTYAGNLAGHQTLTLVTGFTKGYFRPASLLERVFDYAKPLVEFLLPFLIASVTGLVWWLKSGRDAKGRGTIVPEYASPEGISPLEAGTIADFRVDNRDITATIIDLARRGYLKIVETTKARKLLKDKTGYSLVLQNEDYTKLNSYETTLMKSLFAGKTAGTVVELSELKNKLYKTAADLRKSVSAALTRQDFFKQDPQKIATKVGLMFSLGFIVAYIFAEVAGNASPIPLFLGALAGALVFYLFARAMPARTTQGVAAREYLLGLKMYMETAEKDRLEKLEGPNAAYAANASEPVRTVELFEKLLPYAIVLGVEKQWAGKFESIYTAPPEWYAGNWTAFNAGYLAGSLNSGFSSAVNASFSAPSSSSGSGFGGGAGGGGGGGGGGGW